MAKNKVINTVLNLRDNMSGGLIQAAKNAKKSGAQIDDSMMSATRKVVKFKNDSLKALQSWSKKSVVAVGAAVRHRGGFRWCLTARPRNTASHRAS